MRHPIAWNGLNRERSADRPKTLYARDLVKTTRFLSASVLSFVRPRAQTFFRPDRRCPALNARVGGVHQPRLRDFRGGSIAGRFSMAPAVRNLFPVPRK